MAKGDSNSGYDPEKLGQKFGNRLETELGKPAAVFDKPLYAGLGGTTQGAINAGIAGAPNAAYSSGIQGALDTLGRTAAGEGIGVEAPGYQAVRDRLQNDVMTGVNSTFTNSGRFGSGSHVGAAVDGLTSNLGALDMAQFNAGLDRQVQAAGMLPGLYDALQAPNDRTLALGAMQDADSQASLLAQNDLFRRQNDTSRQNLIELLGAFTGSQGNAGMQEQPQWWQQALGLGAGIVGAFL